MSVMNIYIDPNYPKRIREFLLNAHDLQKERKYVIREWTKVQYPRSELKNSIFLLIDHSNKGLSIPILKHYEDGYNVVVCKTGTNKLDLFEFLMTVFRVWPFILEKSVMEQETFLYTFKYGGRKISKFKN